MGRLSYRIVGKRKNWWIQIKGLEDHGPYGTQQEAREDARGLLRTLRANRWMLKQGNCKG
jgi:hypothetical protein